MKNLFLFVIPVLVLILSCQPMEDKVFNDEEAESLRKGLYKRGLFEKCWNFYIAKFNL